MTPISTVKAELRIVFYISTNQRLQQLHNNNSTNKWDLHFKQKQFFINKQICQLNYSNKIREMEILVVATRITTNNFWIYCGLPSARSSYRNRRWHLFNEKVATRRIKFCRKKLCRWRMGSGFKYNWDQTDVVDVI